MKRPVPRENIPWFPSVDDGRCTGCRVCVEFCSYGVYAWDENRNVAVVVRPYECIVGCNGCEDRCLAGAISFPDPIATREVIRRLRKGGE